jgi:hypothetical protein
VQEHIYSTKAMDLLIYPYLFNCECFLPLGAATYKKCQNLWVLVLISKLVNLTILAQKKNLSKDISEEKKSEKKKNLRGALDSAYFHRMRKVTI